MRLSCNRVCSSKELCRLIFFMIFHDMIPHGQSVVARCGPLFNFWKNRSNLFGNLGNLGNFKKCRVDDQMTKLPTSRGMHGHLVTPNIPILQLPNYLPPKAHKVIWQLQSTLSLSCILSNFRNLSNFENLGYFGNLGNSGNFGHLGNFDRLRMT